MLIIYPLTSMIFTPQRVVKCYLDRRILFWRLILSFLDLTYKFALGCIIGCGRCGNGFFTHIKGGGKEMMDSRILKLLSAMSLDLKVRSTSTKYVFSQNRIIRPLESFRAFLTRDSFILTPCARTGRCDCFPVRRCLRACRWRQRIRRPGRLRVPGR